MIDSYTEKTNIRWQIGRKSDIMKPASAIQMDATPFACGGFADPPLYDHGNVRFRKEVGMDDYDRITDSSAGFRADLLCRRIFPRKRFRKQKKVAALSANCAATIS